MNKTIFGDLVSYLNTEESWKVLPEPNVRERRFDVSKKRSIEYEGKTAKMKNLPAKLLVTEPSWTGTVLDTGFKVTKALYVLAYIDNEAGDDDGDGDYKDES